MASAQAAGSMAASGQKEKMPPPESGLNGSRKGGGLGCGRVSQGETARRFRRKKRCKGSTEY
jgi:hypothetical protein